MMKKLSAPPRQIAEDVVACELLQEFFVSLR
jgi:hypothetical protein